MTPIHLPTHARTGLTAIGLRRDGRPIWPIMGGDGTTAPPTPAPQPSPPNPAPPTADPAPGNPGDEPLRPEGLRALQAERQRAADLEKQLKEYEPLKDLVKAIGGGKAPAGKSEIDLINERLAAQEKTISEQAEQLLRRDVAAAKGLNAEQAAELRGTNLEELTAHADRLVALFGTAGSGGTQTGNAPQKTGPRPDPAQGARPGAKPTGREAGLAEAQKRFGKPANTT